MAGEDQKRSEGSEGADLVVAGAGLIGLAGALEAARSGLEVIVVDAGPAERASEVAAGMIAPVGEASWGEEALLAAALDSAERWPGFAAGSRRRAASRSAIGAAAPCTWGSTATRPRSCAASTGSTASSASMPNG